MYSISIALFPFIQSKETPYIFNCGVVYFFFQSNEISCFFNCGVTYFVFVIKRLLISLIMLFSIYLSFSSVELSIIICSEKKLIFLNNKSLLYSLKKHLKILSFSRKIAFENTILLSRKVLMKLKFKSA